MVALNQAARVLLCSALAEICGCSAPPPPSTIDLRDSLPDSVKEAVYTAAAGWCAVADRTHWCPEIVSAGGEAQITVGHFAHETLGARAHNTGAGQIEVSTEVADDSHAWPLEGIMMHEFGHFGIDGHVARSDLMRAVHETPNDFPDHVDALAVDEWCAQQGC